MRVAAVVLLLAALACTTTSSSRAPATAAVWSEEVDLRLDERFVDPGGGLAVQPLAIELSRAVLAVRVGGISETIELHTGSGPLSSRTILPYRIELQSTTIEPSVRLRLSRLR